MWTHRGTGKKEEEEEEEKEGEEEGERRREMTCVCVCACVSTEIGYYQVVLLNWTGNGRKMSLWSNW